MREIDREFFHLTWDEDDAKSFIIAIVSGTLTAVLIALILRRKA